MTATSMSNYQHKRLLKAQLHAEKMSKTNLLWLYDLMLRRTGGGEGWSSHIQ